MNKTLKLQQVEPVAELNKQQREALGLTNEKLLSKRDALTQIIKEADLVLQTVNQEFMKRVLEEGTDKKLHVGTRTVYLVERPVYRNVPITEGAKYNALKTVLDTTILSKLHKEGKKIKGIEMTAFVMAK